MAELMRYFSHTSGVFLKIACLFVMTWIIVPSGVFAQYVRSSEVLFVGTPVTLTLPADADTLRVTYRPGSRISNIEAIKIQGIQRTWTPRQAGLVSLSTASGGVQHVSVRFRRTPWQGVAILMLAGSILFGGALLSFRLLFYSRIDA